MILARHAGALPEPVRRVARRLADDQRVRRLARRPRWGNVRRLQPFSSRYGADRGTPIDRWYLERYFAEHAEDITGRVLEVADPRYSAAHRERITSLDILDIDPRNDGASIIADLGDEGSLPAGAFDCVIVTQTLQYLPDPAGAVSNLWRSVAPGGVLLLSVPAIAKADHHLAGVDSWRLLPAGLATVLRQAGVHSGFEICSYGNVFAAVAFLLGISAEEVRSDELDRLDPLYPMLTCARARKHDG